MDSKTLAWSVALVLMAGPLAAQQQQQQPPPPPPPPQPPAALGPGMGMRGMGGMMGMPGMMGMMGMPGPGRQFQGVGAYAPRLLIAWRQSLGLSAEQVSRLEALAQEARQASDKALAEARTHWDQLAEIWKQPTPDVSQVRTHAQAAMQAMQAARLAHLVAAAQAKAVLTPEQRGRVSGWAEARRMGMRQRWFGRSGPGRRFRMWRGGHMGPGPWR
jgi:Spy/CpxP family protein refolding chaperone